MTLYFSEIIYNNSLNKCIFGLNLLVLHKVFLGQKLVSTGACLRAQRCQLERGAAPGSPAQASPSAPGRKAEGSKRRPWLGHSTRVRPAAMGTRLVATEGNCRAGKKGRVFSTHIAGKGQVCDRVGHRGTEGQCWLQREEQWQVPGQNWGFKTTFFF